MKKILFVLIVISGHIFAQNWTSVIPTTINEQNLIKLETITNRDGIHVVTQNTNGSNSVKYYKLNSSGSVLNSTIIETQAGAQFPNIAGDNSNIYISYRLGENLITKKYNYSSNSWDPMTPIDLDNQGCTGVDIAYNSRGLHLVYSDGAPETHYYLYSGNDPTSHQVVSDQGNDIGEYPTITLSENKVHVSFNYNYAKTRDKNLATNVWENTQTVVSSGSAFERLFAGYNKLFNFYHTFGLGITTLKVKERDHSATYWPSSSFQLNYSVNNFQEGLVSSANTFDHNTHIIYDDEAMVHRIYNFSSDSWSNESIIPNTGLTQSFGISSAGDDVFLIYKDYPGTLSSYLRFTHYDAIPTAPQNLSVVKSANNHPLLSWMKNPEADLTQYKIYKKVTAEQGFFLLATVSSANSSFEDLSENYPLPGQGGYTHYVYYKVTAVDQHPFESEYSNEVFAKVGGASLEKDISNVDLTTEFSLAQNYPNPFNPSTVISYSIPFEGSFTLRVFNLLGEVVSELVNETKSEGRYEAVFDASGLSSGMYFYSIDVTSSDGSKHLKEVKKMLLQK